MSEPVYVVAVLKAKAGKVNDTIAILENLAQHSRQESGCVDYGFYRDRNDPAVILSFETWKDAEAEAIHWNTPHLNRALEAFGEVLDSEPILYKCTKVI